MIVGITGSTQEKREQVAAIFILLDVYYSQEIFLYEDSSPIDYVKGYLMGGTNIGKFCNNPTDSRWVLKQFSEAPKMIVSALTGAHPIDLQYRDFRESLSPCKINECDASYECLLEYIRDTLSLYGLGENIWIDTLMREYKKDCFWIVTDCTEQAEIETVKKLGGKILELSNIDDSADIPSLNETYKVTIGEDIKVTIGQIEFLMKSLSFINSTENNYYKLTHTRIEGSEFEVSSSKCPLSDQEIQEIDCTLSLVAGTKTPMCYYMKNTQDGGIRVSRCPHLNNLQLPGEGIDNVSCKLLILKRGE